MSTSPSTSGERLPVLAHAHGTANTTPLATAYRSVAGCRRLYGICRTGDMANETIDFEIYQATSAAGAGAKLLGAANQLAANASTRDNKILLLSADLSRLLDVDNGYLFAALRLRTGGATGGTVTLLLMGDDCLNVPATGLQSADVIVNESI